MTYLAKQVVGTLNALWMYDDPGGLDGTPGEKYSGRIKGEYAHAWVDGANMRSVHSVVVGRSLHEMQTTIEDLEVYVPPLPIAVHLDHDEREVAVVVACLALPAAVLPSSAALVVGHSALQYKSFVVRGRSSGGF